MACAGSVCCHSYVQGGREETWVSGAIREQIFYRVALNSANRLKMSLVMAAAILAICLLVLVETMNTAGAGDSRLHKGKIAFTSHSRGTPNIYVMNADGTRQKRITDIGDGGALEPAWSPCGKTIAVVIPRPSTGEMNISVLSADGTLRELQSHSSQSVNPTWSPNGTKLAVSSVAPQSAIRDIYIMDSDGSNPISLTKTPEHDEVFPAFSPNGSQICFSRDSRLYVMNADGSDLTPLTDEHLSGQCDWSPDGTKIAFSYQVGDAEEDIYKAEDNIYVINADGSGQTNLTRTNTEGERDPNWSPDGTRIAFVRGTNEDVDIYTMNPDGSDVAQLTHSHAKDIDPDWQPQPRPTHEKSRRVTVHPPDTGGTSLFLVASALLFSVGVLFNAAVKRRM
jgi:Tol biopolymer transport system component